MPWVRLDDGMPWHPKMAGLSASAKWAHIEAICWCARYLTDGKVPHATARSFASGAAIKALLAAGLWEEGGDSYIVHDFLEYNRSKAEVEAERDAARDRMATARSNKGRSSGNVRPNIGRSSHNTDPIPDPIPDPDPPDQPVQSAGDALFEAHQRLTSQALVGSREDGQMRAWAVTACAKHGCLPRHITASEESLLAWNEPPERPWSAFASALGSAIASCDLGRRKRARNGLDATGRPAGMPGAAEVA